MSKSNLVLDIDVIKPGDLIGFSGFSVIGAAINLATYGIPFWSLSHVGIMANAPDGRLLIFESTSLGDIPCEIGGEVFEGTQAHELEDVVQSYRGRVYHYPLYRPLYPNENERLSRFLIETIQTPYDNLGALRSAGIGLSWIESLFRPQDLSSIFCSEHAAAALSVIGILPASNASRWSPNRLIRHLRRNRVICRPRRIK